MKCKAWAEDIQRRYDREHGEAVLTIKVIVPRHTSLLQFPKDFEVNLPEVPQKFSDQLDKLLASAQRTGAHLNSHELIRSLEIIAAGLHAAGQ